MDDPFREIADACKADPKTSLRQMIAMFAALERQHALQIAGHESDAGNENARPPTVLEALAAAVGDECRRCEFYVLNGDAKHLAWRAEQLAALQNLLRQLVAFSEHKAIENELRWEGHGESFFTDEP